MDQNLDEKAVRDIEQELHTEIYPGTEVMRDVGSHHFVKSGSNSVLIPQPSDDEHDPLVCRDRHTYLFILAMGPLALAPMFGDYIEAFDSNLVDVVQFTGVAILVLGFSNFIWVPIQNCYGRRPVLILSSAICFASSVWRARANSYGSFMGACVLNGLGAGPAETAQPTIIADIMFLHERGRYNTLYFFVYFGSLTAGPIISGPMAKYLGWRSFWWFNTGVLGFVTLACIFFFPETRYSRATERVQSIASTSPFEGSTEQIEERKISPLRENITQDLELVAAPIASHPNIESDTVITKMQTHRDPWLHCGKPSRQQWKLFQSLESNLFHEFVFPWKLTFYPIVLFASFVVSWSASALLALNLTQSQVFAAPPYNYNSQEIGFFNFAILIGSLIGLFTAGPLSDVIAARLTMKNGGIREPEMRLLAMIPYVIIMIIGNVVTAIGYERGWNWKTIVIIGFTSAGIQVAAIPSIASTYAVDSYKPVSGAIFVTITVNKNVWGYGFSKFITPWIEKSGYIPPILTNMALITLWCSTGVVFWFWGKRFRGWSKGSMMHRM
ncbi:hypothetical protein EYC80_011105 [Monilinia laxa]|uniref:Major facilitator superfamily (MFS) profile domain-containing protein n=1 Tax=Monilinia laxa TaxID=61186 RepID=A0A5N6JNZ6_MONLA|nr:hypothetical protein EYC80_011105 [Monilinia laxa]